MARILPLENYRPRRPVDLLLERQMNHFPFIIIRLWPHHHTCETDLNELLAALKRNRRACDEVWFATEIGFPPMKGHERSARRMA